MIQGMTSIKIGGTHKLVAVAGGQVYVGDLDAMELVPASVALMSATVIPELVTIGRFAYFIFGGAAVARLRVDTEIFGGFTPVGASLSGYTIGCRYRERLVLAGKEGAEQNYLMSKIGDDEDFDTAEGNSDSAFIGNTGPAGVPGDDIVALMPWVDDLLVFGCDHSIYVLTGDPGDGGRVQILSSAVGVQGPRAFCYDGRGALWFIGQDGLYVLNPAGGGPEPVSDRRFTRWFKQVDRDQQHVSAVYDSKRQLIWCFATPRTQAAGEAATFVSFDLRHGGFMEHSFEDPVLNPVSVLAWDADAAQDREILLGTRGQSVLVLDEQCATDGADAERVGGVNIHSEATLGPVHPAGPLREAKVRGMECSTGEIPDGFAFHVTATIQGGRDAGQALDDPTKSVPLTFEGEGTQASRGASVAARTLCVHLESDSRPTAETSPYRLWAMDEMVLRAVPGGGKR